MTSLTPDNLQRQYWLAIETGQSSGQAKSDQNGDVELAELDGIGKIVGAIDSIGRVNLVQC